MLFKLNYFYNMIITLTKENPVLGGVLSLYGLGVITYIFRNIPLSIFNFLKEQTTTVITIDSKDTIYYNLLRWISENKLHSFIRNYNFSGESMYGTSKAIFTIGYGINFLFYKYQLVIINRWKVEANNTEHAKETISLTVLGRSRKIFNELFEIINNIGIDNTVLKLYDANAEGNWRWLSIIKKRPLSTLVFPKNVLQYVLTHIKEYSSNKSWYLKHGITYKTGILLQGPPGTGKTSFILSICSEFNKNIYMLDLNKMNDNSLKLAISSVPENSIIVMEDIDAYFSNRENGNKGQVSEIKEIIGCSLIGILNALDGIACGHDRIIFATTNHPERLDPALIREGRFDLKVTIDYMKTPELCQYLKLFYSTLTDIELNNWEIKPNIAPCKVQQLVFENRENPLEVLKQVADFKIENLVSDILKRKN